MEFLILGNKHPQAADLCRSQKVHSVHPFRETYLYNNMMYGLASVVAERIGGKRWEDLIEEELYTPLGMSSSSFMTRVDLTGNVAKGYATDDATGSPVPVNFAMNRRWGQMGGSTNIMSNAVDISKWMLFHLNKGRNQAGQQILSENDMETLHKRRNTITAPTSEKYFSRPQVPVSSLEENYALGWKNGVYRGYRVLRHTGTTWGYSSLVTLIPDMNIGFFTTMTGDDSGYRFRYLLHNYIGDLLLGEGPWLNKTTVCSFPEPWYNQSSSGYHPINKSIHPTRSLSFYVGVYHNSMYGDLHVFMNMSANTLQMNYGIGSWLLYPKGTSDKFVGEGTNIVHKIIDLSSIQFHSSNLHGRSTINSVKVTSFETRAPPVFTKTSSQVNTGNIVG
ncbi:penicillin-binding protein 4-like [Mytilus californianus]|uniref:penicillin-binding protein 4-like n=1 Tax=Mytilus californianus TaxID=6549 RepID=UPI00224558DE|nr:penicillin-binding protein 4-like [Mytilus californianus]